MTYEIIPQDYCNSVYYPINYDFILFTQSATNFRQATSPLQHSPIVFSCKYHCNGFSCHQMLLIRVYTLAANTTLLPYYCFYNLLLAEAPNHTSLINRAHIRLRSFFALFGLLYLLYRYCSFNYDIAHYLHSRDMLKNKSPNFTPNSCRAGCWKRCLWQWAWSFLPTQGINEYDRSRLSSHPTHTETDRLLRKSLFCHCIWSKQSSLWNSYNTPDI